MHSSWFVEASSHGGARYGKTHFQQVACLEVLGLGSEVVQQPLERRPFCRLVGPALSHDGVHLVRTLLRLCKTTTLF